MMKVVVDPKNNPELEVDLDHEVVAEVSKIKTDTIIENQIVSTVQYLVRYLNQFHQSEDTRRTNKTKIWPWIDWEYYSGTAMD